jgi:fructose-1,6-bisphosphatase/inositol monophosphatase family enzyme
LPHEPGQATLGATFTGEEGVRTMPQSAGEFRPETLVAVEAVKQALRIARGRVESEEITVKDGRDLVTARDVAVEDAIRRMVVDALGLSMVGEERGGAAAADGAPYWLVDPICGTRNFASGIPLYCVNLALVEGDAIAVAVVGDPWTGELHVAERGRGAWVLKDGTRSRLTPSDGSLTIVVEDGKSKGRRRERAARSPPRHPGRSMGLPLARFHVGLALPGRRPHLGIRGLLGLGHSRWAGQPPRYRSGRHRVEYRRPSVDHPLDSLVASATPGLHEELLDLRAPGARDRVAAERHAEPRPTANGAAPQGPSIATRSSSTLRYTPPRCAP